MINSKLVASDMNVARPAFYIDRLSLSVTNSDREEMIAEKL